MALPERDVIGRAGRPVDPRERVGLDARAALALAIARRALAVLVLGALAGACAAGQQELRTPRYAAAHPDFWRVKEVGRQDGQASLVIVPQFGDAVIDDSASGRGSRNSYETLQAEVELRLYGWARPEGLQDPTREVLARIADDPTLELRRATPVMETPPECGQWKRKFRLFGQMQDPVEVVSRPGFRTVIVGGSTSSSLVGVVARVPFEQDMGLYCHNLRNLRIQLQNLLDGLRPADGSAPAAAPAPPAAPGTPGTEAAESPGAPGP
jgi:hypothetical protein